MNEKGTKAWCLTWPHQKKVTHNPKAEDTMTRKVRLDSNRKKVTENSIDSLSFAR